MFWVCLGIVSMLSPALLVGLAIVTMHLYVRATFLEHLVRIFREKPLFVIPRGQPIDGADLVWLTTADGLRLRGCYFLAVGPRKGVILFGLEFGSDCWSALQYCDSLIHAGYDVFTLEPRNQGQSEKQPGYEQLQWTTDRDLIDTQTAIDYLKSRDDADPRGIGFFGVSKGGSVGLIAASKDPFICCAVTDGIFGIYTTMVPYMRRWITIYSANTLAQGLMPTWFYSWIAHVGVHRIERESNVRYVNLEAAMRTFHRPLLMIHGEGDTYIKPAMAQALFAMAKQPKELWIVPNAKHNQAHQIEATEYPRRVCDFFDLHLAIPFPVPTVEETLTPVSH